MAGDYRDPTAEANRARDDLSDDNRRVIDIEVDDARASAPHASQPTIALP